MDYNSLITFLTEKGTSAPSSEAAEIVHHFTGNSLEWCLLNRNVRLPDSVEQAAAKLASGIPLQYITGRAWFYGDRYLVTPDVLIPQPDTEHLVEAAKEHLTTGSKLLDLCTGSGCISISLLKRIPAKGIAVELSAPALEVARRNAEIHKIGSRLTFLQANVLDSPLMPQLIAESDVIVSNPPYINTDIIDTLSPEVRSEPRMALDGGADGMVFYRRFILDYAKLMKPSAVMILEIGYDQSERIKELCTIAGFNCELRRDFNGNYRVVLITCIKKQDNE
jgi:release factor glutamine methyltransferase